MIRNSSVAVWNWVRNLSVTETSHNTESLRVAEEETFCFLKATADDEPASSDETGIVRNH